MESSARLPLTRPLALIGLLGWLVPGMGQLAMGRHRKGVVMAGAILGLYAGGLALTGFSCVDPDRYRLEFVAHAFAGGPTLLSLHWTEGLRPAAFLPHFDVGRLYVAVASLLNVVAVSDALGDAIAHNAEVRARRAEREREAQADAPPEEGHRPSEGGGLMPAGSDLP